MSVSKLCSTMTGMYSAKKNINDEKYTYRALQKALKELDEAVGFTRRGGRKEHTAPEEGTEARLKDYLSLGEYREGIRDFKVPMGNAKVVVKNEEGQPLIAEVKLIPADENTRHGVSLGYTDGRAVRDSRDIASEIFGAPFEIDPESDYLWFDYFRRFTGEDGALSLEIPSGKYTVLVNKGSEFELLKTELTVPGSLEVSLRRIADLGKENWYAGDLHHHSVFSSPAYPPQGTDYAYGNCETVRDSMRAKGLTFGALSDHHNTFNHREWEKVITEDFLPILSKEISTSNGHVLQLNTDPDVIYHIPEESMKTPERMRSEFLRVTDEIKSYGGHPQLNHPRDMQKAISFPPEFTDIIDIFKTVEIWNGSHPLTEGCTNGFAMRLWLDCLEKGTFLGATTGSDTHDVTTEFWFDSCAYVFGIYLAVKAALENTETAKNPNGVILEGENLATARYAMEILNEELPFIKKWSILNLSSGSVRTYVNAPGDRTPENILKNLEQGHSFLTNGPILLAELNGNDANLRIVSNKPLAKLQILGSRGYAEEFELAEPEEVNGGFDYSCTVNVNSSEHDWFVFRVMGEDVTAEAITNPVFTKNN